jgi:hypothetical protein
MADQRAILFGIANLIGIAKDASNLFNGLKGKLLNQPDEAVVRFARVFDEPMRIFLLIDAQT